MKCRTPSAWMQNIFAVDFREKNKNLVLAKYRKFSRNPLSKGSIQQIYSNSISHISHIHTISYSAIQLFSLMICTAQQQFAVRTSHLKALISQISLPSSISSSLSKNKRTSPTSSSFIVAMSTTTAPRTALAETNDKGAFVRKDSTFRNFITKGGRFEPEGTISFNDKMPPDDGTKIHFFFLFFRFFFLSFEVPRSKQGLPSVTLFGFHFILFYFFLSFHASQFQSPYIKTTNEHTFHFLIYSFILCMQPIAITCTSLSPAPGLPAVSPPSTSKASRTSSDCL